MKKLVALLLAGVMTLSLAACGNQSSKSEDKKETSKSEETVEISFWHAMSGANEEAIQKITDDFMKENPNIKVNLMNQGDYLDLFDKLMASAKAKQLPNLAQIYSNRLSWYVDKGLALDITPYINDPKIGLTDEDKADFPDMFMKDCIWGDGQYAMPFNKSQMVLYYNVDMFKDAGIAVPTTWEDWAAAAKALTKDTDGDGEPDVYGIVFADNLSTDIAPWLKQAGGSTMNEETNELYAPMKGEVLDVAKSADPAFASKAMGEGVAINPSEGIVYAPADGTISLIFPTKHAMGITLNSGVELLIHAGIDTVKMNGEGFETFVETGAKVKKGDKLLSFDMDLVKEKGYKTQTMFLVADAKGKEVEVVEAADADNNTKIMNLK